MADEFENYRKPDKSIDWGKYYGERLREDLETPEKKIIELEDMHIFKLADELSDYVWNVVQQWDWFVKKTIGDQLVRSADSIAANIAEGYGRYFFGEYAVFLYYARGSLYETKVWVEKAKRRGLLKDGEYEYIIERVNRLPKELNAVIKNIKFQQKKYIKKW